MIKTTIHGEAGEVSRLEEILGGYYFCDKIGKINLDGMEKEVRIHLELEEKEVVDDLVSLGRRKP